jgi:type I restriction enzyme S subunit
MSAIRRLKLLLAQPLQYGATESGFSASDGVAMVRYIRITDIDSSGNLREEEPTYLTTELAAPYLLRHNDILLARSGATVGKAFLYEGADDAACFAGYMIRARVNEALARSRFIYYSLQSDQYWNYVRSFHSQATIQNLNARLYGNIPIPLPPVTDQDAIVQFLDREAAKADALHDRYELLGHVLEERRIAIITQAVTRGLDAEVRMKSSGIEAMTDIPDTWIAARAKFYTAKIGSGVTPRGGAAIYLEGGVAFLRSQNVYDDGLRLDDVVYVSPEIDSEMSGTRLRAGDVLLNITGASIGRTSIVPDSVLPANVNQHVCILRPTAAIVPDYLAYSLKAAHVRQQILSSENGSSREGLNYKQVGDLAICVPNSIVEQQEIVRFLNRETESLDRLLKACRRAAALVKEHRAALVSAAVTGLIDVTADSPNYAALDRVPA